METCLLIQRRMRRAFRPRRRPWNSSRLRFRVEPRISSPLCRFEYTCVCFALFAFAYEGETRERYFFGIFGCEECKACFDRVGKEEKYPV